MNRRILRFGKDRSSEGLVMGDPGARRGVHAGRTMRRGGAHVTTPVRFTARSPTSSGVRSLPL